MRSIIFHHSEKGCFTIELNPLREIVIGLVILISALSLVLVGRKLARFQLRGAIINPLAVDEWHDQIASQQQALQQLKLNSESHVAALTTKLAMIQAETMRLNALGHRLTKLAKLDEHEFDFNNIPGQGGVAELGGTYSVDNLFKTMEALTQTLEQRSHQLAALEGLLSSRKQYREFSLHDPHFPIDKGWLSSGYGNRIDPLTGRNAWHAGIDFAGSEGAPIRAVAAGIITWAGTKGNYGNLIEISHGNGLVTRYGHNKQLKVKVGDIVKKGDNIATMGSTGRSTGPHLHFEVRKNGHSVNPMIYFPALASHH